MNVPVTLTNALCDLIEEAHERVYYARRDWRKDPNPETLADLRRAERNLDALRDYADELDQEETNDR